MREFPVGEQVLPPARRKLPAKINRAGAFKFHADSPVELITGISLSHGARCKLYGQLSFKPFPVRKCARYLNLPRVLDNPIVTRSWTWSIGSKEEYQREKNDCAWLHVPWISNLEQSFLYPDVSGNWVCV